ncbi:MAG: hypothetical protein UR78_C0027G0003 [Candidatus Moranbacteria bacterium GW2011_GWF2_35_39]|nr:MAG: hypothetical protein UR78_C0027G0003 [Candidatus Moranbacteria bacterium GW2011_GWF2_35_39]
MWYIIDMKSKIKNKNKSSLGEFMADKITNIVGSWKFIIFQSILLTIWIILNITAWINHWDPYPFILLNLVLSFQAAYTAPVILMSENRQAERDRKKEALDLATDRKAEREIEEIKIQLDRLEKNKIDRILDIINKKK